jgi:Protein of unknown function (DUF2877)
MAASAVSVVSGWIVESRARNLLPRGRRTRGCRAVGRGPGLTPSGDDVLVGILATLSSSVVRVVGQPGRVPTRRALVTRVLKELARLSIRTVRGRPRRGVLHSLYRASETQVA